MCWVATTDRQTKAFHCPCRSQKMLRVTVREDFSYELASDLITDLKTVIEWLDHHFIYSGTPCCKSSAAYHPAQLDVELPSLSAA